MAGGSGEAEEEALRASALRHVASEGELREMALKKKLGAGKVLCTRDPHGCWLACLCGLDAGHGFGSPTGFAAGSYVVQLEMFELAGRPWHHECGVQLWGVARASPSILSINRPKNRESGAPASSQPSPLEQEGGVTVKLEEEDIKEEGGGKQGTPKVKSRDQTDLILCWKNPRSP